MQNKIKGKQGEQIAQNYLKKNGYEILETNFHFSRFGEVDIIAKKDGKIIFTEVKLRSSTDFGHPFEAITRTKLKKIFSCAQFYLSQYKTSAAAGAKSAFPYKGFQIDVISVLSNENPPKIEHLKNIEL